MLMDAVTSFVHAAERVVQSVSSAARAWNGPMRRFKEGPVVIREVRLVDPEEGLAHEQVSDIRLERGRIAAIGGENARRSIERLRQLEELEVDALGP